MNIKRGEIYALIEAGKSVSYIAAKLNKSRGTIYNEIRRGSVIQIKQNKQTITYLPDVGQAVYDKNRKSSRRSSKLEKCKEFINFAMTIIILGSLVCPLLVAFITERYIKRK